MIYMSAVVRWVVAVVVVVSIAGILTGKFPLKASPAQPSPAPPAICSCMLYVSTPANLILRG